MKKPLLAGLTAVSFTAVGFSQMMGGMMGGGGGMMPMMGNMEMMMMQDPETRGDNRGAHA